MKTHSKLGAAVIGMNIGEHHARAYQESPHVDLKAVCALSKKTRSRCKQELAVDVYEDMDELLARDDIHLVSVCTPDYTHREVAEKVLAAGKHMLLEKSIALTLDDADAIIKQADGTGTICTVGFEFRVNPVMLALKQLLESGELGEFKAMSLYYWRGPFRYNKSSRWIQRLECSGGVLVSEACHWFDLMRWFGGEVQDVQCNAQTQIHAETEYEDIAYAHLRFANGTHAQMSHSLAGFGTALIVWIFGTEASAWAYVKPMDGEDPFLGLGEPGEFGRVAVTSGYPHGEEERVRLLDGVRVATFGPEARELANIKDYAMDYAARVAGNEKPLCSLDDGRRSLEISLAARASALDGGQRVELPLSATVGEKATAGFLVEETMQRERTARPDSLA
jgi:predicted dehydrogenase